MSDNSKNEKWMKLIENEKRGEKVGKKIKLSSTNTYLPTKKYRWEIFFKQNYNFW